MEFGATSENCGGLTNGILTVGLDVEGTSLIESVPSSEVFRSIRSVDKEPGLTSIH